jgi:regulator of RNase E activity RraA
MKRLTGRFPAEDIRALEVPRPPAGVVEALAGLPGVVCLVSDVLDGFGLARTVGASTLRPVLAGRRIVGPALTILKLAVPTGAAPTPRGDLEAHNLTTPGDVLVIQGQPGISSMGGLSALTGQRQGSLGAVIRGGCRDVAELRAIGYPVWSTEVTPITGVGRQDSAVINGEVEIDGIGVRCGDIVVADDDGVCFVPADRAEEVVESVRARAAVDESRAEVIRRGRPLF